MTAQIEVELQEWMGSDQSIANAAWTSTYDKSRREDKYDDPEKVAGIVKRCVVDGHSVPLESVVLRFWIRMPVFVDRQHITHRMASHNGLSGRYRTLPEDWFRMPSDVLDILAFANLMEIADVYANLCLQAHQDYTQALFNLKVKRERKLITNADYKRVREVLRAVLPTAFMVERTSIFNLVSFANYQRLRNSDHAQPEIRQVAQLMLAAVKAKGIAPIAIEELENKGWSL